MYISIYISDKCAMLVLLFQEHLVCTSHSILTFLFRTAEALCVLCLEMRLQCSVCLSLLTPLDDVTVTACGHVFHVVCLVQWLEYRNVCPQVRFVC